MAEGGPCAICQVDAGKRIVCDSGQGDAGGGARRLLGANGGKELVHDGDQGFEMQIHR